MRQSKLRSWLWLAGLIACASAPPAWAGDRSPGEVARRAALGERVRVIVELDEATIPEGWLTDRGQRLAQRARIADAQSRLRGALADSDASSLREYRTVPFVTLEVGPRALAILESRSEVRGIRLDGTSRPFLDVSVPHIGGDQAHDIGFDGSGQVVVIMDSGVDGNHQNFSDKIVAEACFAEGNSGPPSSGDCPNGGTSQTTAGAGAACDFHEGCYHGTHVAGIAAGSGPQDSGVAPGADLIPIQVFSYFPAVLCPGSDPCLLSFDSDQDLALEHVYDTLRLSHDIASVNMSLGADAYDDPADCDAARPSTKALIDQLRSVGIATVIASGNDSCSGTGCTDAISLPACISSAVSVGATRNASDFPPPFGNKAPFMSLFAPGQGIEAPLYETVSNYLKDTGTSMSAPHVAGAFAVVRQAVPGISVDAALANFQATGAPVNNGGLGVRRIAVKAALDGLGITDCSDGIDNDGDGLTNLADPGCASAADTDEQNASVDCDNGLDDDLDGDIDSADSGCETPADTSEYNEALVCDNGVDDDLDSFTDLADPGCRDLEWSTESPQCQDGIDNDGDGGTDWDGNPPDSRCVYPYIKAESQKCGLGAEVALGLIPWALWRTRRRARPRV